MSEIDELTKCGQDRIKGFSWPSYIHRTDRIVDNSEEKAPIRSEGTEVQDSHVVFDSEKVKSSLIETSADCRPTRVVPQGVICLLTSLYLANIFCASG